MTISFDRRKCQELCEKEARAQQGLPWNSQDYRFDNLWVNSSNVHYLVDANIEDAIGAYYNAIVSFLEGCIDLFHKRFSWASIKLYYSVFYGMKSKMGFKHYALLRKNGLYILFLAQGEKAKKKKSNDHFVITECFRRIFPSDFMLSNSIDGIDFLTWITELREITNYREMNFREPYYLPIFDTLSKRMKMGTSFSMLLNGYQSDFTLSCFQEDSAYLAMPLHFLLDIASLYKKQSMHISTAQRKYVKKLLDELRIQDMESLLL